MFEEYFKKGFLKRQPANAKQILSQINRAKRDLETARDLVKTDPEWAATIAYQALLRSARALIFSYGYLPANGAQHRTVVELTGQILGKSHFVLTEKFEKMRRKRNLFFYDFDSSESATDAKNAQKAAVELVKIIDLKIQESGLR